MTGIDRVKRELEESIEHGLSTTPLQVIVMGPNRSDGTAAARLRQEIIREAGEFGAAIPPEHEELIAVASKGFGPAHNLTAYEIHLVNISHLAVLIPESAGSLCELGLFSSSDSFAKKLLILSSSKYPRSRTYIADGPLKMAEQNRAEVHYVDYNDIDTAWSHVHARLKCIQVDKNINRMFGRQI